uniref:DUF6343 family protein n=2 Tax=unclassified Streptomyces TaxID=2593676 RepID=UPI0015E1A9D8
MADGNEDRGTDRHRHPYRAFRERYPRSGSEPVTALSDLPLRLILSLVFVPLFLLLTLGFALWWARTGDGDSPTRGELGLLVLGCALLTVLAVVDLFVVVRRLRQARARAATDADGRTGGRPWPEGR